MVAGHKSQTWKLMLWFGRHKHGDGIGSGVMRANAINSSNGFCSLKDEGAAGCGRSTRLQSNKKDCSKRNREAGPGALNV